MASRKKISGSTEGGPIASAAGNAPSTHAGGRAGGTRDSDAQPAGGRPAATAGTAPVTFGRPADGPEDTQPTPRMSAQPAGGRPSSAAPARQASAASAPVGGYTAGALAELAGVTVRALHHYEAEGLLHPARDASGYRRYGADQVERLQQILLFRACGLALGDIRRALDDPAFDRAAALRSRLADLRAQQEQLKALMGTVEKTIAVLEGEATMTDKERFEGLKRQAVDDNEKIYGAEARERWGDAAVDAANERTLAMDEETWNDREALGQTVIDQLRAAFADGAGDPAGPEARALAEMHGRWLALHWGEGAYSREAHAALADGYVADERFTRYYDDAVAPGATRFLRDAIVAWAAA